MLNEVRLIGRLGQDPELTELATTTIAKSSLATWWSKKDDKGEFEQVTEWHDVVVFGNQARYFAQKFKSGDMVLFMGSMRTKKWQNDKGEKKVKTEVVGIAKKIPTTKKGGNDQRNVTHKSEGFEDMEDQEIEDILVRP